MIENVINDNGRAVLLGGYDVVVVSTETAKRTAISNLAARLISDLSAPYMVGDSQIIIGASIGIATGPHEGATSDDLLRHADLAPYAAKKAGRGAYRFYEASMRTEEATRRSMEMDQRGALASGHLAVVNLT